MKTLVLICRYSLLVVLALNAACATKKYYPIKATYSLGSVTAHDLEEDFTGQDEVRILYSVASFNKDNSLYAKGGNLYGPVEFSYKGDRKSGIFKPLTITVPAKGKLLISVQLSEDDDYSAFSDALSNAEDLVNIAKFASKAIGNRQALRTFSMVSRRLSLLGNAVTLIDILDYDDELMAFTVVIDEEQLRALTAKGFVSIQDNYQQSGSNWGDRFSYEINFGLMLSRIAGPIEKERIRARAPNIVLSGSPILVSQPLNSYWTNVPDRMWEETAGGNTEFSDGLINKIWSASLGIGISPAIRLGQGGVGKFYLYGHYQQLPYLLDFANHKYTIDNAYFKNTSNRPPEFKVVGMELDIRQYGLSPAFKVLTGNVIFDMGGGFQRSVAQTHFISPSFGNPNASLSYQEDVNVFENTSTPFGFAKLGFGRIRGNRGSVVSIGLVGLKPNYTFNNNFKIYSPSSAINKSIVPATNDAWRVTYQFGIDVMF